MSRLMKVLLASIAVASVAAPLQASAGAELRTLGCSASIDYLLNNVLRQAYRKDFVLAPGVPFSDDFSTFIRFKFFDASTQLVGEDTVATFNFFSEVGVFDYVDLTTGVTVSNGGSDVVTTAGTSTYFTSLGTAGEHTTKYSISCQRIKQ